MAHFEKDEFIFRRFASQLCTHEPRIKSLKVIGTDQDIYN